MSKTNIPKIVMLSIITAILLLIGFNSIVTANNSQKQMQLLQQQEQSTFDLILLNSSSALCLDGSNAAYYLSQDGNAKNIYLQFQGGGWCGANDLNSTLESCYQRSNTNLGSSKGYANIIVAGSGSLSGVEQNNFKDWKRVLITYCDGAGHQGTKNQSVKYKDADLYFRGHNNTVEILQDLEDKIKMFSQAEKVVVGGDSAGGLAVYLWTNYIAQKVAKGKVWALPDSGIFLDSINIRSKQHSYKQSLANVMKLSNVQIDPPVPECVQQFKTAKENCMFAQNIYQHIKVPQFPIQSLYDTWSIPNILGIYCIKGGSLAGCTTDERREIQVYHRNVTNLLFSIGGDSKNGFWAPACANHVYARNQFYYSTSYRIPAGSVNSASNSVQEWLEKGQGSTNRHIDQFEWPGNKPCSGVKGYEEQEQIINKKQAIITE